MRFLVAVGFLLLTTAAFGQVQVCGAAPCVTPIVYPASGALATLGGGAAWGVITGTLSNQADLQSALNAKGTSNFSGAYADLTGKPTLGTAAATAIGDYATSAQGALAASALQPAGNGSALTGLTKSQVGLANADNTSDAGKPVSTAQQTALDLKAPLASPTFTGTVTLPANTSLTTPVIGVATGTSLAATGLIKSSGTAGVGYATGAGGTVTQATSKTTGVTINKTAMVITMNGAALAAAAEVSFVVTNSTVAAVDVPVCAIASVGTAGAYFLTVGAVSAGSFAITLGNASAGSLSQAVVINCVIIKGANS